MKFVYSWTIKITTGWLQLKQMSRF